MRSTWSGVRWIAVILFLFGWVCAGVTSRAWGQITYSYTGNPFNIGECQTHLGIVTCMPGNVTEFITFPNSVSGFNGLVCIEEEFSGCGLYITPISFTGTSLGLTASSSSNGGDMNAALDFENGQIIGGDAAMGIALNGVSQFYMETSISDPLLGSTISEDLTEDFQTSPAPAGLILNDPGTWTLAGGATPSPSLYLTVSSGGPNSSSGPGHPTSITANLTLATAPPALPGKTIPLPFALPSDTATLQQAAAAINQNFVGFDWMQSFTTPIPSPFFSATDPCVIANPKTFGITCASSALTSTIDPPPGEYANFGGTPPAPSTYPFYYNVTDAQNVESAGNSDDSCIIETVSGSCAEMLGSTAGTVLKFFDSPTDTCIATPSGGPSQGYTEAAGAAAALSVSLPCTPDKLANGQLAFMTELVGITNGYVGGPCSPTTCVDLANFSWIDNFNGLADDALSGTGGISFGAPVSDMFVDPMSGTGGITILSVDGSPIPEPSTTTLLMTGILLLIIIGSRRTIHHRFMVLVNTGSICPRGIQR